MTLQIGEWEVRPESDDLVTHGRGVKVTPRDMDVLVYLAGRPGKVVGATELLNACWPSSAAADNAVYKSVARLRKALGDTSRNPTYIKTIPKRGYCLVAEVHGCANQAPEIADDTTKPIAVLPFKNIDGIPENQYLVEGIAEALLDGLAKLTNLRVTSRADAFRYSLEIQAAQQIGAALAVDYLVDGSVQRVEDRLRVSVQLIRIADRCCLYSDQFDKTLDDILAVQDDIAIAVVKALEVHLDEKQRSQMLQWGTTDVTAYLAALEGRRHVQEHNWEHAKRAIDLFLYAIDRDPSFVAAYQGASLAAYNIAKCGAPQQVDEMLCLYGRLLQGLERHSPNSPALNFIRQMELRFRAGDDHLRVEEELRRQILSGEAPYTIYGHMLSGARLYEEALQYIDLGLMLDPVGSRADEASVAALRRIGPIYSPRLHLLDRPQRIHFRKRILDVTPNSIVHLFWLVLELSASGECDESRWYLQHLIECDSGRLLATAAGRIAAAQCGELPPGSKALEASLNGGTALHNGQLCFAAGDIERGIPCWERLAPGDFNQIRLNLNLYESTFAEWILHDPRYHELLERIGLGKSWQRHLIEKVIDLGPFTGIELREKARTAYENDEFLIPGEPLSLEEVIRVPNEMHENEHGVSITLL